MDNKLTIKLDNDTIIAAKKYARQRKTSLSQLVEYYFKSLVTDKPTTYKAEKLAGCLKHTKYKDDAEIMDAYLKHKHHV